MNQLAQALWVETLKARRSNVPLFTALGFALIPLAFGFFMIVLKDPALALRVGLISAKARLLGGAADWPTFLTWLNQSTVGGVVLFGLIASWVFGREYADHTVKDLLALPTSRSTLVLAKFIVVGVWSAALTVLLYGLGLGVGVAVGLPPAPAEIFWRSALTIATASGLSIALLTPIAFCACAGHGYLPALSAAMLALMLAQFSAAAGWGAYFPWAIPAAYVQGEPLGFISYGLVCLTSLAGIAGTLLWWEFADQTH